MARIEEKLGEARAGGRAALISYIMAGYPRRSATLAAVRGLVRGGTDVIELGFPFSDPLADGPTIQSAGAAVLKRGMTLAQFLDIVKEIRAETDIPLVMMTYANILYNAGYSKFIKKAARAGIDGFVIPDMPADEAAEYLGAARECNADTIFLISPNTDGPRIKKIAGASTGFLYLVAVYGTTGIAGGAEEYSIEAIRRAKRHSGGIPVGVGFGVSTPKDVRRYVGAGADAVIVGSAYLRIMKEVPQGRIESEVASLARSLRRAARPTRG